MTWVEPYCGKKNDKMRRMCHSILFLKVLWCLNGRYTVKWAKLVWFMQTAWRIMGVKQPQSPQSISELSALWHADIYIFSWRLPIDTLNFKFFRQKIYKTPVFISFFKCQVLKLYGKIIWHDPHGVNLQCICMSLYLVCNWSNEMQSF